MSFFKKDQLQKLQQIPSKPASDWLVLIIDDEQANLEVMQGILKTQFHVLVADSAEKAKQVIAELKQPNQLACIVSDQRMPKMTGVEFFSTIKHQLPDTQRIIVTGYIDLDAIIESVNSAAIYKFVIKPFDFSQFLSIVKQAVDYYEMRQKLAQYHFNLELEVQERLEQIEDINDSLVSNMAKVEQDYMDVLRFNELSGKMQKADELDKLFAVIKVDWEHVFGEASIAIYLYQQNQYVLSYQLGNSHLNGQFPSKLEALTITAEPDIYMMRNDELILGAVKIGSDSNAMDRMKRNLLTIFVRHLTLNIANINLRANLFKQATRDPLTNLYNRRYLSDSVAREFAKAKREGTKCSIVMLDIDHFKQLNDNYGHDLGDDALKQLSDCLLEQIRSSDIPCRLGGEEFLIVLPNSDLTDAQNKAEKIRVAISQIAVETRSSCVQFTASFGVASFPEHGENLDQILKAADRALYRAKELGRDRVIIAN